MSERIGAVSDGAAEDIIRSFTQLICTEGHYKTLIEKYNSELNNGLTDDPQGTIERMNDAMDELTLISELRRSLMLRLQEDYGGDTHYWCVVKHLSAAAYNAFEAYQASDNDGALMTVWLDINARFIKALSRWLGFEPMECSACFADAIKGKGVKDNGTNEIEYSV